MSTPKSIAIVFGGGDPKVWMIGSDGIRTNVTRFLLSLSLLSGEMAQVRLLGFDGARELAIEKTHTLPYVVGLPLVELAQQD